MRMDRHLEAVIEHARIQKRTGPFARLKLRVRAPSPAARASSGRDRRRRRPLGFGETASRVLACQYVENDPDLRDAAVWRAASGTVHIPSSNPMPVYSTCRDRRHQLTGTSTPPDPG